MSFRLQKIEWGALIFVLAVAVFFQFYQLGQVPPGLFPDEAAFALDGLNTLDGHITLYSKNEGGAGALWRFLLAPYFAIFGATILSLRAFAGIIAALCVLSVYGVSRELILASFDNVPPVDSVRQAGLVATLSALLLAVSFWFVQQSRPAFPTILMVLLQNIAFFCMWRALRTGQKYWFWLFGAALGLMAYAYLPGKLVPIVPALFFLAELAVSWRNSLLLKYNRLIWTAAAVSVAVALPILLFIAFNFDMIVNRALLPSAAVSQISPWQGLQANLAVFGLWPAYWLADRGPSFFLPPTLTALFVVGVVISLIRLRKPVYLFLLIWWALMLLPGAFASEGAVPHPRRASAAIVPTFIFISLGLTIIVDGLFTLSRRLFFSTKTLARYALIAPTAALIVGAALTVQTGADTLHRYFAVWGTSEAARQAFHVYDLELAELMARESGPETVYLLPLDSAAGIINPLLDTITFVYRGEAGYDFLPDDEQTMLARLAELTADRQTVRLLRWKVSKHTGADPKNVAAYHLEKWGDWAGTDSYSYFDIDTYRLVDAGTRFTPSEITPLDIDFEQQMTLTGFAFGPEALPDRDGLSLSLPADRQLWVELNWHKASQQSGDYQVGIRLEDEAGHVVGRVDKPLLGNITHQPVSAWPPGRTERDYYLLRLDPALPPGDYRLKTVLYTSDGHRLAPRTDRLTPDLAVTLGHVAVTLPLQPPDPAHLAIPQRLNLEVGEGITLLGFDPGFSGPLRPGDRATLTFWWQSSRPVSKNLVVSVGVGNEQHVWSLNKPQPLVNGSVVQLLVDIRLPAEVKSGTYNLGARLLEEGRAEPLSDWLLGPVEVSGRTRIFDIPAMAHPVNTNFGDRIILLGYDLDISQVAIDGNITLTLYWQAQSEMDAGYKVFVHFLDGAGQIVRQIDREPQAGNAPTTGWLAGEVIADRLELPADEALSAISQIAVGLYDALDGERLPVSGQPGDTQTIIDLPSD